jgi:hypothetical protein
MVRDHYKKLGFTVECESASGASRAVLGLQDFRPTDTFIRVIGACFIKRSQVNVSCGRIFDKIDPFERTLRDQPIRSASVQSIDRGIRANAAGLRAGKRWF